MKSKLLSLLLSVVTIFSVGGVYGNWSFAEGAVNSMTSSASVTMQEWIFIPEQEVNIVNKFTDILNREEECSITIGGTTYTDSFDALIAAFNNSPRANRITLHNNSYIGTMQQTGEDVQAVRDLFGDVLVSEETADEDYELMLKREPLDGRNETGLSYYMDGDHGWVEENKFYSGAEMVLFSTSWDTNEDTYDGYVIVYATVYTRYPLVDSNGNYIQATNERGRKLYYNTSTGATVTYNTGYPVYEYGEWVNISGETAYVGQAMVVDYSTADSSRSFATGTWVATESYEGLHIGATLNQIIEALTN